MFSSDHQQHQVPQRREKAREPLRGFEEQNQGTVWARWEYGPEEWAQFDAIDYRPRRRLLISLLSGLASGLGFGAAFSLPIAFSGTPFETAWITVALIAIAGAALGGIIVFFATRSGKIGERHLARTKRDRPRRVSINKEGVWIAGTHFSFSSLDKVTLTGQPPVLRFHYRIVADGVTTWNMRVLVPRGHEAEAERLGLRIQADVIEEMRRNRERWNNPPEPR